MDKSHVQRLSATRPSNALKQVCLDIALLLMGGSAVANTGTDQQLIASLDIQFQAAVKANDADTMAKILHPDMVLILGDGRILSREDQLLESQRKTVTYEIQDEEPGSQSVRVLGDTGVVTALLRIKGRSERGAFDRRVWFSDTYVRSASGWKYFLGQASLALPSADALGHK